MSFMSSEHIYHVLCVSRTVIIHSETSKITVLLMCVPCHSLVSLDVYVSVQIVLQLVSFHQATQLVTC